MYYNHSRSFTNVATSTDADSLFGINTPTIDESLLSIAESTDFNINSLNIIYYNSV